MLLIWSITDIQQFPFPGHSKFIYRGKLQELYLNIQIKIMYFTLIT